MRYSLSLASRPFDLIVEEHASGPKFVVDGDTFEPKVERLGAGEYRVKLNGRTHTFRIENGRIHEGPHQLDVEVRRARPILQRARAGGRRADGRVKPPMPGKVVEVKVKEGQTVKEGDVLLVLEAMKMQNDVKSPLAGIVKRVLVKDGANVEASSILVEVDAGA